jgi:ribulose-phosphate 3-epimerase
MEAPFQPGVNRILPAKLEGFWNSDGTRSTGEHPALLAASMICGNPLNIGLDLQMLEEGGINLLHFDVMDGTFVPRIGVYPELIKAVKLTTNIPIDVHLMIVDAERYIPIFANAGADIIVVHVEATAHLPRVLELIRRCGALPGVALNPATTPQVLTYVLNEVDFILLMTINPGVVGQKANPLAMQKISDTHHFLEENANKVHIIIDGNVKRENAGDMVRRGASILVCGSSSIFNQELNVRDSLHAFRDELDADFLRGGAI